MWFRYVGAAPFAVRYLIGAAVLFLCAACDRKETHDTPLPSASPAAKAVEVVLAPAGQEPVEAIVQREMKKAQKDGRDLVIYVGAEWCEPCKRFKAAAKRGELDSEFPTLRLLEFDRDRDEARLQKAQCITDLIPLYARPTEDGRCDQNRRTMGGIKGPGTVQFIARRMKKMLAMDPR
jgi:hypothetical protein